MKIAVLFIASLFTSLAVAASPSTSNDPVNCWDSSFAYTNTRVKPLNEFDRFYVLSFGSEDQRLFPDLIQDPIPRLWGDIGLKVILEKSDCAADPVRPDVLTCTNSQPVSFDITYQEEEATRTLHLLADKINYTTRIVGKNLVMDFEYTAPSSKHNKHGSAHLEFRLDPATDKCIPLL